MKFDPVELEHILERSLQRRPQWRPHSRRLLVAVEAAVFISMLGYWLLGLAGALM